MTAFTEAYGWRGRTVVDRDGEKIGKVSELYLDWQTDQPEWALVQTGPLGTRSMLVPLIGAAPAGEDVRVAHTKDQVMQAPSIEPDAELSQQQEAELCRHYGLTYSKAQSETGLPEATTPATGGRPGADDAWTRSEEELPGGGADRERGRLRKYVQAEDRSARG